MNYYASLPVPWTDIKTHVDPQDIIELPKCSHITLQVMLPYIWIPKEPAKVLPTAPVQIKLTGLGCFENKDRDVLFARVELSEQLLKLHTTLVNHYNIKWEHGTYVPHVTIAFLRPGTAKKYLEKIKWAGANFTTPSIEWRAHKGKNELKAAIHFSESLKDIRIE